MPMAAPLSTLKVSLPRSGFSGDRMAGSDWGELMVAAQSGNTEVYHRLLVEVGIWLHRYYTGRLPPAMIEDAVQDTLLAIHEKRHMYDPLRPFEPWLAAIARYKWIDRLRAMKSASTEPLTDDVSIGDHGEAIVGVWTLEQLLKEIKPAQSDVIRLVKLQGLSIQEASARTGQSVPLVKVNIHRGMSRLTSMARRRSDAE